MKKILAVSLMAIFSVNLQAADMDALKAEAKQITGAFFQELKGTLGKSMKADGPVGAIKTCQIEAPGIASKHAEQSGWNVGRTSLKLRNPANAPDGWEVEVLNQFEQRRANGEGPDTLAYAEQVEINGEKHFRFMKAIVMPPADKMPCLKCHGDNLDPAISAKLEELYPADQAKGYKAGQVRGAFSLSKKL